MFLAFMRQVNLASLITSKYCGMESTGALRTLGLVADAAFGLANYKWRDETHSFPVGVGAFPAFCFPLGNDCSLLEKVFEPHLNPARSRYLPPQKFMAPFNH